MLSIENRVLGDLKISPKFYNKVTEKLVQNDRKIDFIYK